MTTDTAERIVAERAFAAAWADQVVTVMVEFFGLTVEPDRRVQLVELALHRASAAPSPPSNLQ
jgi:hypothetical protein